jgi:catechol 2,3-dioxygenase-like lactoylglutathione lyase family enzyme
MTFSVDTVFVWVTDLDRSVDWFRSFGIEAGPGHGDWQPMEVGGDVTFALHRGERPPGSPSGGIAFAVDDLEGEMARLERSGIKPADDEVTDTGVSRFITYSDPDGNHVQLLER